MSTLFLRFYLMYKKPFDPKRKPFIFRRSVRNSRRIDCTGDRMKMLFPLLIFLSVFFGLLTGNMNAVAEAAMTSAGDAIDLVISLTGTICLWGGIMETAKAAGITAYLTKALVPFLRFIFGKKLPEAAAQAAAANLSANLMGLGNAAPPLGLTAVNEMQKIKTEPRDTASDQMVLFTVMNTSSLQLFPATLVGLRLSCGSAFPAEILPAVWVVSLLTFAAGILAAKLLSHIFR